MSESALSSKHKKQAPSRGLDPDAPRASERRIQESYNDPFTFYQSDDEVDFQEAMDRALAQSLQEQLNRHVPPSARSLQNAHHGHHTSNTGKALNFAQAIIETHEKVMETFSVLGNSSQAKNGFSLVNADDIVYLAERLFHRQNSYRRHKKDTTVDVGYRYTETEGMSRIRTDGLMSHSQLGEGIYTANNCFAAINTCLGDKLLLVARLKGDVDKTGVVQGAGVENSMYDSVVVQAGSPSEICILRRSSQCIPLLLVDKSVVNHDDDGAEGNNMIHVYHCYLQKVLDTSFNNSKKTVVPRVLPSQVTIRETTVMSTSNHLTNDAREPFSSLIGILYYTAPEGANIETQIPTLAGLQHLLTADTLQSENCLGCNISLREQGEVCRLPRCGHEFHIDCLAKKLKRYPDHCPACQEDTGFLPGCHLRIEADSKPQTLVIDSRVDYENSEHGNGQKQCTTTECHVTMNQPLGGDRNRLNQPRLSFTYACGSSFDVSLSNHSDKESVAEAWHKMFDSTEFLQRFQLRVQYHSNKCSSCRRACKKPRGKITVGTMPSGMMRIEDAKSIQCSGYDMGSFLITYRIDGGMQKSYHPSPGRHFDSTYREAYLPKNFEGYNLLKRLKFAFSRGMTFQVGKSISTGLENQIVWSSIPHRTSVGRSTFGFPDADYFIVANKELDDLGVPSANNL